MIWFYCFSEILFYLDSSGGFADTAVILSWWLQSGSWTFFSTGMLIITVFTGWTYMKVNASIQEYI